MQVLGSQTEMRSIDHRTHFAVDMGTIYCSVNSTVSVSPVARVSGHSIFLSRFPTLILIANVSARAVHTKQGSDETDHIQCPSGPNTLLNLLSGAHSSRRQNRSTWTIGSIAPATPEIGTSRTGRVHGPHGRRPIDRSSSNPKLEIGKIFLESACTFFFQRPDSAAAFIQRDAPLTPHLPATRHRLRALSPRTL